MSEKPVTTQINYATIMAEANRLAFMGHYTASGIILQLCMVLQDMHKQYQTLSDKVEKNEITAR